MKSWRLRRENLPTPQEWVRLRASLNARAELAAAAQLPEGDRIRLLTHELATLLDENDRRGKTARSKARASQP